MTKKLHFIFGLNLVFLLNLIMGITTLVSLAKVVINSKAKQLSHAYATHNSANHHLKQNHQHVTVRHIHSHHSKSTRICKKSNRQTSSNRLKSTNDIETPKQHELLLEAYELEKYHSNLLKAYGLYNSGQNDILVKNYQSAKDKLNEAKSLFNLSGKPGQVMNYYLNQDLANIYTLTNEKQLAKNILIDSLSESNNITSEQYINIITILLDLNHNQEAIDYTNEALKKYPENLTLKSLFAKIKNLPN